MIRRYSGDKKSIEARSADNGRLTEYSGGTLAEVDALANKNGMTLVR